MKSQGSRHQVRWETEVCILRAPSRAELITCVADLAGALETNRNIDLKDLAYTLNTAPPLPYSLSIVATSVSELRSRLLEAGQKLAETGRRQIRDPRGVYFFKDAVGTHGKIAFLFPGEGAQYPQMLADVCMHFPEARAWFDLMDRAFFDHPRGYLPSELVFPPRRDEGADGSLWKMDGAVETVFAANQALFALLTHLGVRPDMIAGHSSGDYSALFASGCMTFTGDEQLVHMVRALNAVYEQFAVRDEIPEAALLAVGSVKADVIRRLLNEHESALAVALDNCPQQIVLCGAEAAIDRAARLLQSEGAIAERLPFGRPYHTPLFESFSAPLREFFDQLHISSPKIDIYSCATAAKYPRDPVSLRDLAVKQWTHPVRFHETIEAMYEAGARVFIEVGPRGNLTGFVENILRGRPAVFVAINTLQRTGLAQINHAVGMLAAHGVAVNTEYLYSRRAPRAVALQSGEAGERPERPDSVKLSLRLPSLHLTRPHVQAPAAVAPPDARARVMHEYLESMEQFLRVEREVMQAALTRGRGETAPAVKLPFIDRVVSLERGLTAVAICELNLDEHRFMRDHTLGAGVSSFDADLIGLPVLPLAVSIEMLAEAASLVRPGLVAIGARNLRAHRWVVMESDRLSLQFTATAAESPDEVRVQMHEAGERSPLVEATIVFADRYPPAERVGEFPLRDDRPSKWPAGEMYGRTGMFHGPAFQLVDRMGRSGEDGAEATFVGRSYEGWLRSNRTPAFLMDPMVLDAMGQVVGYWVGDRFRTGLSVFPVKLERLELFAGPRAPGVETRCRVRVTHIDDDWILSDIEVVSDDGVVIARMRQWEDRRLDLPRGLYDFRIAPSEVLLSEEWPSALTDLPDATVSRACRMRIPRAVLEAHGAIWLRVLVYLVLGREERREWQRFSTAPMERRLEWLAGRIAAKDAIRLLLKGQLGSMHPADIEICGDQDGRLSARGPWINAQILPPDITISHSGVEATAVAVDGIAPNRIVLALEPVG